MDPAKIKEALEAIKNGDADAALALLEEMIASAAGGGEAEGAPAESDALADNAETPPEEEPKPEVSAALSRAVKVAEDAQAEVKKLTERLSKIEKERAAGESAERLTLIADLVKLGAEVPATAWQGKPEDRKPARRLADEPIAELRARVEVLRKARPAREIEAPAGEATELSRQEQEAADKITDPQAKQRFINLRLAKKGK